MIYFITNEDSHYVEYKKKQYYNITVLTDNSNTLDFFNTYIKDLNVIGFDVETNGLDAYNNKIVLAVLGDKTNQFVIHTSYADFTKYYILLKDKQLMGHNIKFDLKMAYTYTDILYSNVYDTMIAEQRIFMKSGISSSLENVTIRRCNKYPDAMDKEIRKEFIDCNVNKFKIEPKHIYYAANDVGILYEIRESQEKDISKYNMEFLIFDIEFPLIHIIAKAELTGFEFDKDKWLSIYYKNLDKMFTVECKLDVEVRRLRDELLNNTEDRIRLVGGKWDNIRRKTPTDVIFNRNQTTNVPDLFGEMMSSRTYTGLKKKPVLKPNNIKYDSSDQIIYIFGALKQSLPTDNGSYIVPFIKSNGKIDKLTHKFKTGEGELNEYLSIFPNSPMKDFIALLLEHREYATACNTFGINFIDMLNPVTGKIHTVFRQCRAATGRFQSGDTKNKKPNFQNIPSKSEYAIDMRNCFKAREGYSIGTHDLSGAELIIMCSLSQDLKLLKIAMQDIHSYVAQGSWRLIYADKAKQSRSLPEQFKHYMNLAKTYVVSKTTNKKERTRFKPMTFGTIYGMYAKKAAKTLNITEAEGQIVINFIKREFPEVFKMVEAASEFAVNNGYLVLNNRTKSRAWFPRIIDVLKQRVGGQDVFRHIYKEVSEARNIRIQGTQADMIKEITVNLQNWIDENNFTDVITILSWVHDEIIDEHPKYLDGKSEEWLNNRHNTNLHYRRNDGTIYTHNNFPDIKAEIMKDTCNQYLKNVTMDVEYDVEPYWTK